MSSSNSLPVYSPYSFLSSFESLTGPPRNGERTVLQPFTLGASDRVWKIPFTTRAAIDFNPERHCLQICTGDVEVMKAAADFLARYNRPLMAKLAGALGQRGGKDERLIAEWALDTTNERTAPERAVAVPSAQPAPSEIVVPSISSDHWAYRRHKNVGNWISYPLEGERREAAEHAEASSDIGGILGRIEGFSELAKDYTGQRLYNCTKGARFGDTYTTYMTLCTIDLELPAHFIALLHYGMGICSLTGVSPLMQLDTEFVPTLVRGVLAPLVKRRKPDDVIARDRAMYEAAHEALDFFVKAYLEDFGARLSPYGQAEKRPSPGEDALSPLSMPSLQQRG